MLDNRGGNRSPLRSSHPLVLIPGRPMAVPFPVGFFHRRLQPQLDQPQYAAVADPPRHRLHQLVVGDAVEVSGEVGVHHLGVPRPEQPFDLANGVQGAAFRTVGVLFRLKIGLEDGLQDQHSRHRNHAVFDAWNPQRPELARLTILGDVTRRTGWG
jgi:hypothetical protein